MKKSKPAVKLSQTTIKLPPDLHRKFRVYLLNRGISMQKWITDKIEAAVAGTA